MISLSVKPLYTNLPADESIKLAADLVYEQVKVPDFRKELFITVLGLSEWYAPKMPLVSYSCLAVHLVPGECTELICSSRASLFAAQLNSGSWPALLDGVVVCRCYKVIAV